MGRLITLGLKGIVFSIAYTIVALILGIIIGATFALTGIVGSIILFLPAIAVGFVAVGFVVEWVNKVIK